jgi:pimeloyl-ACP methyl ester carboxylesterase
MRTLRSPASFVALAAAAALLGCAAPPMRPDLVRLYRVGTGPADTTPVILIPGLFGSKLRDRETGVEVWPGRWNAVLWSDYRNLALSFDPTTLAVSPDSLEAYALADEVLGHDIYRPIVETLEHYGNYVRGVPGTPARAGERLYYVFPYDWRQDNVVHARELEQLIETIRRDHDNPDLRVDIVAHSMGGLIARYYLRYGTVDVLEGGGNELVTLYGTSRVRKLILLGTPNMGSAGSLHAFITGEPVGFGRIPPECWRRCPRAISSFRIRS